MRSSVLLQCGADERVIPRDRNLFLMKGGYGVLEQKLKTLPDLPGVYRFLAADQSVLYVGKATSLKSRVHSYFTGTHSVKTQALVSQISDVEVTVTDNTLEALLLENTLIKKYRPKYNIMLKDDRAYPYLKITKENFPRLVMAYRPEKDGARYFGPYASTTEAQLICQVLNEVYPIVKRASCGKRPPCLYYHLGMCLSPYHFEVEPSAYQEMIDHIVAFLRGDRSAILNLLNNRMNDAANLEHYEAAAKLRDQIAKLKRIQDKQTVILNRASNLDMLGYAANGESACLYLMVVRHGVLIDAFGTLVVSQQNAKEDIREFIERYYIDKQAPQTLLLPVPIESDIFAWKGFTALIPKRGRKWRLMQLATKNAQVHLKCHPGY